MEVVCLRKVRVRSIASAALESLRRSSQWEVHSVFDRAFNIVAGDDLVGVSCADVPLNPINLVTDISGVTMQSLGIEKGMSASFRGDVMRVGNVLEISFHNPRVWTLKVMVEKPLPLKDVRMNLEAAEKAASKKATVDGFGQLLRHLNEIYDDSHFIDGLNVVSKKALPEISNLVQGVKAQNLTKARSAVEKLVGLGSGLTPSADDFLAGFSCSLAWMCRSYGKCSDFWKKFSAEITSHVGKTNLLSRKLLEHAVKGESNERVEELLETILHGHISDFELVTNPVLEIGETSGADMMVGLLLGIRVGVDLFFTML